MRQKCVTEDGMKKINYDCTLKRAVDIYAKIKIHGPVRNPNSHLSGISAPDPPEPCPQPANICPRADRTRRVHGLHSTHSAVEHRGYRTRPTHRESSSTTKDAIHVFNSPLLYCPVSGLPPPAL